jgi:dihydroorotase
LSIGAEADVAVLNLKNGDFGFIDSHGFVLKGKQKLEAELTMRAGKIEWDLNGRAAAKLD